jgi:hypothetical protein
MFSVYDRQLIRIIKALQGVVHFAAFAGGFLAVTFLQATLFKIVLGPVLVSAVHAIPTDIKASLAGLTASLYWNVIRPQSKPFVIRRQYVWSAGLGLLTGLCAFALFYATIFVVRYRWRLLAHSSSQKKGLRDGLAVIWLVCAIGLPWGLGILARRILWKPFPEEGACPSCGYDLRASPEKCPECGTVRAAASPASPPGG